METDNPEDDGPSNNQDNIDDEEYYENPVEIIQEFGTHPLMERAQKALTTQLKDTHYRLQIQLLEKADELKVYTKEREILGVQLYNLQQQLARIQLSLEKSHNDYNGTLDARLREEELFKAISKNNNEQISLFNEYQKQRKKHQNEIEQLNDTIRQIQIYNEEVKSEIALTKRAAYKTEQSMTELEKTKENQDTFVDNLNHQIKVLQEQVSLHIGQYNAQKKETTDATEVLMDTTKELNLINEEKRQLMTQWKTALSSLARRDEALSRANAQLTQAESAVNDYDVEIASTKRDVQAAQSQHESLVALRDRMENELNWVEENLTKIRTEKDALQERYTFLSKSLQQTDLEAKKLDVIAKQIGSDAESLLSNLQIVTQERHKVEEQIQSIHSTHSNINKAVSGIRKQQSKLLKSIQDKEIEGIEIEHELAKATVDRLNISSAMDQLKEQHNIVIQALRDKEAMIAKYQLEIRQRTDEVEKKMYRVDRLNKKYDRMTEAAGGEENLGPLENGIKILNKEAEGYFEECKELERDWLRKQTELVTVASEGDALHESKVEYQARVTLLSQQRLRLVKESRQVKLDLKVANQLNVDLNKDIAKLNLLISANHHEEEELQTANYINEKDCVEDLKLMEKQSLEVQSLIAETKNKKAKILDEILECERQALLWEKKIQLDKEARAALDPSVGQAETAGMEKEIHRMQLRYDAIKREEERLATEMENAIYKRSAISTRYKGKEEMQKKLNKSKDPERQQQDLTQASAKKRIGNLKREARIRAEEIARYNEAIEEKKATMHEISSDLERMTMQFSSTEELNHQLQGDVNDLLYHKQLNQERIAYRDKYLKRLRENFQQGIDLTQSLQIERRMVSAEQALDSVKDIIESLQNNHPHLLDVFQRVGNMTNPTIEFAI